MQRTNSYVCLKKRVYNKIMTSKANYEHDDLLRELNDKIDTKSTEYHYFINKLKTLGIPDGRLDRVKKEPLKVFDLMTTLGFLGVGNYDPLENAIAYSKHKILMNILKERKQRIADLMPQAEEEDAHKLDPAEYDREGKKGFLLILNFSENRKGTEIDVRDIKKFFGDTLNFEVYDPRDGLDHDLSVPELDDVLKATRDRLNSKANEYYCFFCAILSHGDEKEIQCGDGGSKNVDDITKTFSNAMMVNFVGKPKVFLIQACRGRAIQMGHGIPDVIQADNANVTTRTYLPTDADVLIAYPTTQGYEAYRRPDFGTWFIQVTISVFKERHKIQHVEEMFTTIKDRIATDKKYQTVDGGKMMPETSSTLRKKLRI